MDQYNGFSHAYPIEFLAKQPIHPDREKLAADLRQYLGRVRVPEEPDAPLIFFLEDFPVVFKDGSIPAQLTFLETDKETKPDAYEDALHQSRSFPKAREVLKDCRHSVMLMNMMCSPLSHETRRAIISNGVKAAIQTMAIDAVHWSPTQQLIDPADIVAKFADPREVINPTQGFLNVRFFKNASRDGEMVMDTLGLNALGLTDFQIHYRDLDAGDVAGVMWGLGGYAFEKGDVIEDGHTVQGPKPEDRWRCRREESLLDPKRTVLDIDPGPPFAAGGRN